MSAPLVVALDAMGGDAAPKMVVKGMKIAHKRYPDVHFLLFGDEGRLNTLVKKKVRQYCTIRHTPDVVTNDDKPSQAVRQGQNTSMWQAIKSVKDGEAAGVVSAGNTGALMAMAKLSLRTLSGIDRPAIATILPTIRGEVVMLDLGANASCDANNLVEFAIMGDVFARILLGLEAPSIGLLNIGSEDLKGTDALRQAAATLKDSSLKRMNVAGFIEGNDIVLGTVDVVVTDGFTGNVALKAIEGTAKLCSSYLKSAFEESLLAQVGYLFAKRALDRVRKRIDPRRYNGAMFLGLAGICVKSHGGTDAFGFANAISVAVDLISHNLNDQIKEECSLFAEARTRVSLSDVPDQEQKVMQS